MSDNIWGNSDWTAGNNTITTGPFPIILQPATTTNNINIPDSFIQRLDEEVKEQQAILETRLFGKFEEENEMPDHGNKKEENQSELYENVAFIQFECGDKIQLLDLNNGTVNLLQTDGTGTVLPVSAIRILKKFINKIKLPKEKKSKNK